MATLTQVNTSEIPSRIWFVNNAQGGVDSIWASRRLARSRKRALRASGVTGVKISSSQVTISSPVTDTHS